MPQPRPRPSIFIYIFLIFSAFHMKRLGLGDLGAGRRKDASEKIEGLVDFPTTRPKLP